MESKLSQTSMAMSIIQLMVAAYLIVIGEGVVGDNKKTAVDFMCSVTFKIGDIRVDCSSRQLTYIPILAKEATSVDLSNNSISAIFITSPFDGMNELRELDLSDNPLDFIPDNLFRGLINLQKLYIRNSLLYYQKELVLDSLLSGLINLRNFSFTFLVPENTVFSPIPCSFKYNNSQPFGKVDSLRSIETLEIDTAFLKLKTDDSNMGDYQTKDLRLVNGFVCYYGKLTSDQFINMPLLENLFIHIPVKNRKITNDFVTKQPFLKQLSIEGPNAANGDAREFIFNVTESVSNSRNLTTLILNDISNDLRLKFNCHQNIANISNLEYLNKVSLTGNSLSFGNYDVCSLFPTSLKILNLQNNCLSSLDITYVILFNNKQIEQIDASDQSKCAFLYENKLPPRSLRNKYSLHHWYEIEKLIFTNSTDVITFGDKYDHFDKLKYLDLSLNNKLDGSTLPNFLSMRRPNLEFLKISDSRLFAIENNSFSYFTKLEHLDLSSNMLGNMGCSLSDRFHNLTTLKELNLAKNSIQCAESYMLSAMKSLEKIDLSFNKIHNFDVEIPTHRLTLLDLSNNQLQQLNSDTRNNLDRIAANHKIFVNILGNVLLCTCDTLDFLQWMIVTKVHLVRKREYKCSYSNGSITELQTLKHIVRRLHTECASNTVLIVALSSLSAFVLVCIAAIFAYKFRWKIRYFYYKTKIQIPYKRTKDGYEQIFEYDVFISYSTDDYKVARVETMLELEEKLAFRACIHERDFLPGESIAYNVSRGIRSSRRTIAFFSTSFLASEWCLYELNIARMESLHTGRKVILMVLLEDVPKNSLPVDILDIISSYTYLEYPKHGNQGDRDVFWSKCADFIKE